ncbi:GNAT family N-acetyltransferase [Halomarina oriensis]|uniref:GNAT family N-acetyltransferase n=1 Tax=Halomarina oriensis TaxID=671145 RepID=A0A6B0GSW8_9EURY|nr:GNAT family N-acetyltransferase [Halomarina oriensis]MWG35763.1 GNAT family N-acetyltransferase [Halomarina oriensis]
MTDERGPRVVVDDDREAALDIRRAVFVEEQDVPEELELDEYDDAPDTDHVVAYDGETAVGTARLRPSGTAAPDPVGKVQRVAVLADRRGDGWGSRLMRRVETLARERGYERLTLDVQTQARGFYERLGYEVVDETEFVDAGIPHVRMEKRV